MSDVYGAFYVHAVPPESPRREAGALIGAARPANTLRAKLVAATAGAAPEYRETSMILQQRRQLVDGNLTWDFSIENHSIPFDDRSGRRSLSYPTNRSTAERSWLMGPRENGGTLALKTLAEKE